MVKMRSGGSNLILTLSCGAVEGKRQRTNPHYIIIALKCLSAFNFFDYNATAE